MVPLCIDILTSRLIVSPISLGPIMSFNDQKKFERFIFLGPPKFSNAIEEDAYEILLDRQERLHNLESLESYNIAYMTYQLNKLAKHWWRSFTSCRLLGLPTMIWT